MAMPAIPSVTGGAAGPSSAADTGNTNGIGSQTVGDYYGRGSRVRRDDSGWNWQELAVIGVVALAGVYLWQR